MQTADDRAWIKAEDVPGGQPTHRRVLPSLYRPAAQAVQASAHAGHATPEAVRQPPSPHDTHWEAPAGLPVLAGHGWHASVPVK